MPPSFLNPTTICFRRPAQNVCVFVYALVTSHLYNHNSIFPLFFFYLAIRRHTSDPPHGCQSSTPRVLSLLYPTLFTTAAGIRNIYILLYHFPNRNGGNGEKRDHRCSFVSC